MSTVATPFIPQTALIRTADLSGDLAFGGMKLLRCQSDPAALNNFQAQRYEFQFELARRHMITGATLALKGAPGHYRIIATVHPTLRQVLDIVKYDPSNPPLDDYDALGMKEAHEQTQSDFRGAKKENLANFKQDVLEAIRGERAAFLPSVSGWQSSSVFADTIFVAFDEGNPLAPHLLTKWLTPVGSCRGRTERVVDRTTPAR